MAYASVADVRAYGVDESLASDTRITDALAVADAQINEFCGRDFLPEGVRTLEFFGVRGSVVPLPPPFRDITAVKAGSIDLSSGAYEVTPTSIRLSRRYRDADGFVIGGGIRGLRIGAGVQVQVTGTFGFPVVPAPVREACTILAARRATTTLQDLAPTNVTSSIQVEGTAYVAYHVRDAEMHTTSDVEVDRLLAPYTWGAALVL